MLKNRYEHKTGYGFRFRIKFCKLPSSIFIARIFFPNFLEPRYFDTNFEVELTANEFPI